jgi:cAMP-dependent protein kinase regulator
MLLINAMERYRFNAHEVIIKQGDAADYFYVLKQGRVRFLVDSKNIREASDGVSFGELALLHNAPRSASVVALAECFTYRVDQYTFRALLASHKLGLEKTQVELLRRVSIFKDIDRQSLAKIADAMTLVSVPDGKLIIRKGDVGRVFYIIQRGEVEISEVGIIEENCSVLKTLKRGDFFGERALITGERRSANAMAVGQCTLLCISKETFETIVGSLEDLINNTSIKRLLKNIPLLANAYLEPNEWKLISGAMSNVAFSRGTIIVESGRPVADFRRGLYLVRGGEITISSKEKTTHLRRDDTFGEDLILTHQGHAPSFTAIVTEDAVCNMVSVEDICKTLGGLDRLRQSPFRRHSKLDASITLDTISKIRILGSGTYGQVWLARHKSSKKAFALKILNKREVINKKIEEAVFREKNLMQSLHHPFIIELVNTFQNKESLFMVTNFVQGGELFSVIHTPKSNGICEHSARFYAANIYEGLLHMHERRIVYRDLKPEVSCTFLIGGRGCENKKCNI